MVLGAVALEVNARHSLRFSHRQPCIPEPFKEFFEARGIGNGYDAEKI